MDSSENKAGQNRCTSYISSFLMQWRFVSRNLLAEKENLSFCNHEYCAQKDVSNPFKTPDALLAMF